MTQPDMNHRCAQRTQSHLRPKTLLIPLLILLALQLTPTATGLQNGGFETGQAGTTPTNWSLFANEQQNTVLGLQPSGSVVNDQGHAIAAQGGSNYLVSGASTLYLQEIIPAMEAGVHYRLQVDAMSLNGQLGKIYFATPQPGEDGTISREDIFPLRSRTSIKKRDGWRQYDVEHCSRSNDAGKPLYIVLETSDAAPQGRLLWDDALFSALPDSMVNRAGRIAKSVGYNNISYSRITASLQEVLDTTEPSPVHCGYLAFIHTKFGMAAGFANETAVAQQHHKMALTYRNKQRERYPDDWFFHNEALWIENELFWSHWNEGRLGVCQQIKSGANRISADLIAALRDEKHPDFANLLRRSDYGKWTANRMEVNFLEASGHVKEALVVLDRMISEMQAAKAKYTLFEGNANQLIFSAGLAANLCLERGDYASALSYVKTAVAQTTGQQRNSIKATAQIKGVQAKISLHANGPSDEVWAEIDKAIAMFPDELSIVRDKGTMYLFAKEYALARDQFSEALEIAYRKQRQYLRKTLRYRAMAKLGLGDTVSAAEDVVEALRLSREAADKSQEPALYHLYGRCVATKGIDGLAFDVWNTAYDLAMKFNMHYLALEILLDIAELQAKHGLYDELALTWQRINQLMADHPDIAPVWLVRAERLRPIHLACFSGHKKAPLPSYTATNSPQPAPAPDLAPAPEDDAGEHGAAPTDVATVFLQPATIETRVVDGEIPGAHFVLYNSSAQTEQGSLSIQADTLQCEMSETNAGLAIAMTATEGTTTKAARQLTINPGENLSLFLRAEHAMQKDDYLVELEWTGKLNQSSEWIYGLNQQNTLSMVADASFIEDNPFFFIPFRHSLRFVDSQNSVIDLIVRSSRECRIEIYDTNTGSPLAIDATGDGDFSGVGDVVYVDENETGYPDVSLASPSQLRHIEIWTYPAAGAAQPGDETDLTLSAFIDGEWVDQSVDTLIHTH